MLGYLHNSPPFEVDATTQLFEESLNDPRPRTESLRFKALPPSALQPQPASSAMNSFAFSYPSSSRLSSLLVDTTELHAAPLSPPSSSFALPLIEASPSVPQTKSKPASKKNRRSASDDEPKKKTSNKKRKTQQSSSDDDDDDETSVVNIDVIPKNREAKKARRRLKNRLAAQNSRERKKAYVQTLEEQVAQLQKQNEALQAQLRLILDERSDLQHKASSRSRKRSHMSSSVSSSILSPVSPCDLDDVAMSSSSSMSSPRSPTITTEALLTVPVSVPAPHPHPVSSNVKLEFHQGVSSQEDASAVSAAAFHFSGDSAVVVTSSLPSMNPRVVSRSCLNSSTRSSLKASPTQIQVRPISSSPSHLTSPLSQKSPSPSEQLTLVLWVVALLQLVQRLSLNIPLQTQAQASKTPLGSTRPSPSLTRKKTPWSPYPSPSPSLCRQHRTWQALSMSRAQKLDLVRARATATSSWTTNQQTESLSPPSLSNSPDPMVAPAAVLALDSMASAMALCQRVVSLYVCSSVLVYCLSEQRRRLKQV